MLNFNTAPAAGTSASSSRPAAEAPPSDLYKVLVMDRFCKDILAPLLRVNELRRQVRSGWGCMRGAVLAGMAQ